MNNETGQKKYYEEIVKIQKNKLVVEKQRRTNERQRMYDLIEEKLLKLFFERNIHLPDGM